MTTPTPSQTRKAVQRVFELTAKVHRSREMAIVATAQTLCLRVEEVRAHLDDRAATSFQAAADQARAPSRPTAFPP